MPVDAHTAISGQATRALVQSRDLTRAEARLLTIASAKRIRAAARRHWLYWVGFILMFAGVIGWFACLNTLLKAAGNSFFGLIMLVPMWAAIIGVGLIARRQYAAVATATAAQLRAGSRFELGDEGLRIEMTDMEYLYAWQGITAIVPAGRFLYVHVGAVYMAGVPCSAFENQDVAGFCAELEHRWKAARGSTA